MFLLFDENKIKIERKAREETEGKSSRVHRKGNSWNRNIREGKMGTVSPTIEFVGEVTSVVVITIK